VGECRERWGGLGCEMGKLQLRGTRGGHCTCLSMKNVPHVESRHGSDRYGLLIDGRVHQSNTRSRTHLQQKLPPSTSHYRQASHLSMVALESYRIGDVCLWKIYFFIQKRYRHVHLIQACRMRGSVGNVSGVMGSAWLSRGKCWSRGGHEGDTRGIFRLPHEFSQP
jgi:hypothetical protein